MRRLINILTIVLLGVLYSCSSKADYAPNEKLLCPIDTISVGLTFYNAEQAEVTTKAPLAIDESAISNLNIYLFNEQGALLSHKYTEDITKVEDIVIYKGQKYTLYVVANAGKSLPCTRAEQVEELSITISSIEELVNRVGAVLMSGKSSLVTLTDGSNIDIKLSRCISKFSLAFNYTELNSGVAITIKRAQLFNAPSSIKLFGVNKAVDGNVLDGELYEQSHLGAFSSTNGSGVAAGSTLPFYLFENMQGTVASGSLTNKDKEQQMSSNAKSNSSYLELEYEYLSSTRKGTIVYRFYLGNTHADCNIERNTNYLCTLYFKGDGSANENSWSVDNSALVDRVTSVAVSPTALTLRVGESCTPTCEVLPADAIVKDVVWSSLNSNVATVDVNGKVTAVAVGKADIKVASKDNAAKSAICMVTVVKPIVEFSATKLVLYEGEVAEIPYSKLLPSTTAPTVTALNSSVVEVLSATTTGVKVKAKSAGTTTITADLKGAKAQCTIEVQKLQIIINNNAVVTLYQGFNEEISYTVTPERAKNLAITWSSSNQNNVKQISGNKFQGGAANSSATITASFVDYPTVKSSVTANVKAALKFNEDNVSAYASTKVDFTHPAMYSSYIPFSTDKDAKITWSGNYVGSGNRDIHISDRGFVTVGSDPLAKGTVIVTGTVTADNGSTYSDTFAVDIYQCVLIKAWASSYYGTSEYGGQALIFKVTATCSAPVGNRLSFTVAGIPAGNPLGSYNVSVGGYDTEILDDLDTHATPSSYRERIVTIEKGTEHDKSGVDGKYRFYYSGAAWSY